MLFLEEKPITKEELKAGIRRQTIANKFVPVAGGSAFKNKGVQYLLDAVVDYLPGPLDIPPAQGLDPDNLENQIEALSDDNAQFLFARVQALERSVRRQARVLPRLFSGKLTKGDTVYNPRTNKRERISRIIQIQADKREDIDTCYSGDIAAIVGIKNITTGDTLCDEDHASCWSRRRSPTRSSRMAIEPKTKVDQEKMGNALQRLSEEDPTFRVFTNEDTGQTIIAGMGELHLEIIRDRMLREFKVDANSGKPQIAYRETITAPAGRRGQAHQAVRRSRSVRPRHRQRPAQRARQGPHHREQGRRRHDPEGIHPRLQEGHRRSGAQRRRRRLPGGRRERRHHRRLLPRRGLQRNGVQARRDLRGEGRLQEGEGDPARTHHEGRSRDARKITRATSWAT